MRFIYVRLLREALEQYFWSLLFRRKDEIVESLETRQALEQYFWSLLFRRKDEIVESLETM